MVRYSYDRDDSVKFVVGVCIIGAATGSFSSLSSEGALSGRLGHSALRLNANLDFGIEFVRRSDNAFSNPFNC